MRNVKFIEAKSMNHFGLINITRCGDREINTFIQALTRAGQEMGKLLNILYGNVGYLFFSRYRHGNGQSVVQQTLRPARFGK